MRLAVFAVASLALAGCASISVHSRVSPQANLARYRTFAFYPSPEQRAQPKTIADQEIENALARDLAARGFVPAAPGQAPDFLVAYHVRTQQKVDVTSWGYDPWAWGWGPYWGVGWGAGLGPETDVRTYTQGTIIVDFVDARNNHVFWRGTASSVVNDPYNISPKKIDRAVAKLVEHYPYEVAGAPQPAM